MSCEGRLSRTGSALLLPRLAGSQPLPQASDAPSLRLDFFGLRFVPILERPSRRRRRPILRLVQFRNPAADLSQNGRDREAAKQREDEKRTNADRNPDPNGHLLGFDAVATNPCSLGSRGKAPRKATLTAAGRRRPEYRRGENTTDSGPGHPRRFEPTPVSPAVPRIRAVREKLRRRAGHARAARVAHRRCTVQVTSRMLVQFREKRRLACPLSTGQSASGSTSSRSFASATVSR